MDLHDPDVTVAPRVPTHKHAEYATDEWIRNLRTELRDADAALADRITALETAPAGPAPTLADLGLHAWADGTLRTIAEVVEPDPDPVARSMYAPIVGPGVYVDSRDNQRICRGPGADPLAIRFVVERTVSLTSVGAVWRGEGNRSGLAYSQGDGGRYRVDVCRDANGLPGDVIATAPEFAPGNPNGGWERIVRHDMPPTPVSAGDVLHARFTNVHADPPGNHASLNGIRYGSGTTQPAFTSDLAMLVRIDGEWQVRGITPAIEVGYADGTFDGQGYNGIVGGATTGVISGQSMVRERFALTDAVTVTAAVARVGRVSGSEPLTVSLVAASGVVAASGTIAAAAVGIATPPTASGGWSGATAARAVFPAPVTLPEGWQGALVLSCAASGRYHTVPVSHGIFSGGQLQQLRGRTFPGAAERSTNGGASWSSLYGGFHVSTQTHLERA